MCLFLIPCHKIIHLHVKTGMLFLEMHKKQEHYSRKHLTSQKNDLDHEIRFWRTRTGIEVDFILGRGDIAIESKMSTHIQAQDTKGPVHFHNNHPQAKLYIVCLESRPRLMSVDNKQIYVMPIQKFLEDLWGQKII